MPRSCYIRDTPGCRMFMCGDLGPHCAAHLGMWNAYRESGGVQLELDNVVPYRGA